MEALVLNGNVVENVVLVNDLTFNPGIGKTLVQKPDYRVDIGFEWDGTKFIDPNYVEPKIEPVKTVTPLQARMALHNLGLLEAVDALLAQPDHKEAQLAWEYGLEVQRDSPFIVGLGTTMGMTTQEIDDLFALASTL